MTRSILRQRDLERIFRDAKAIGACVQIDPPAEPPAIDDDRAAVPFGQEN